MNDTVKKRDVERAGDGAPAVSLAVLFAPAPPELGELTIAPSLVIGREGGEGLDLAVPDAQMSRRHARVWVEGGRIFLEDLGSTNGTFVEGARVERAELAPGTVVRAGDTLLEVGPPARGVAPGPPLVGRAPAFLAAIADLDRVATSSLSVLIHGETGTGKELASARLHARSGRTGPLVTVNCAAIPRDLLESTMFGHRKGAFTSADRDAVGAFGQADGGTLFLDEIADLPLELQPKILRAVESGEIAPVGQIQPTAVDVRVVSATHSDLAARVEAGSFRRDLQVRLSGFVVELPPLRRRRGDLPLLVAHFAGGAPALTADFLEPLLLAAWPGNVRELRQVVQRALLLAGDAPALEGEHARAALRRAPEAAGDQDAAAAGPGLAPGPPDRATLEALIARYDGRISRVAAHYGKDRKQVYRWMRRLGIPVGDVAD